MTNKVTNNFVKILQKSIKTILGFIFFSSQARLSPTGHILTT